MARTAVVNRRRRRSTKRRRRNYGAASVSNPRRRRRRSRRRNYGAAAAINPRRRRRSGRRRRSNPISPYSSGGYRQTNPGGIGGMLLHQLFEVMPSATIGIMASRFAVKQFGEFEKDDKGSAQPTLWHALAVLLAANVSNVVMGSIFGGASGAYSAIAALGYGGDLFLRHRFLRGNVWMLSNMHMSGLGEDGDDEQYQLEGFQQQSPLGSFVAADGNTYVASGNGSWQLAGLGAGQIVQGEDGTLYEMSGPGDGAVLAGFQQQSPLGFIPAQSNPNSSFGYAP